LSAPQTAKIDTPSDKALAEALTLARAEAGDYTDLASKALSAGLKHDGRLLRLLGTAFLNNTPRVTLHATFTFDFQARSVLLEQHLVSSIPAIMEKIGKVPA
jgi:hypothetical protein